MHLYTEYARTQTVTARERITQTFGKQEGALDAEFFSGSRKAALGFGGLPYEAPLCARLMNRPAVASYLARFSGSQLLWLEEESYEGISRITGLSRNNVAVRIHRAKEKIRTLMEK